MKERDPKFRARPSAKLRQLVAAYPTPHAAAAAWRVENTSLMRFLEKDGNSVTLDTALTISFYTGFKCEELFERVEKKD